MTVTATGSSVTPAALLTPLNLMPTTAPSWSLVILGAEPAGVDDAVGARPVLRAPMDLPPQLLIQLLVDLQQRLTGLRTATSVQSIQINESRAVEKRDKIIEELTKAIDAAAEALKAADQKMITDWILVALGVLIAAVAIALTAGALAPALMAASCTVLCAVGGSTAAGVGASVGISVGAQVAAVVAVAVQGIGLVMASMELATSVARHCGATTEDVNGNRIALDLTIKGFIQALQALAIKNGDVVVQDEEGNYLNAKGEVDASIKPRPGAAIRTREQLQQDLNTAALGFTVVLSIVMLVGGAGGSVKAGAGITKAASLSDDVTQGVSKLQRLSQTMASFGSGLDAFTTFSQGAVQIGGAVLDIRFAQSTLNQSLSQAEKALAETELETIMQTMAFDRDAVNRCLQQFDATVQMMAAMIQQIRETMSTVARNTAVTSSA